LGTPVKQQLKIAPGVNAQTLPGMDHNRGFGGFDNARPIDLMPRAEFGTVIHRAALGLA
jgi:hypothetical protein